MPQAIRQHFLPRFLMAGFASRRQGRNVYSYHFRIGCPPHQSNIQNIGGEGYFYTRAGDILQDRDTQHARLLTAIREKRMIPSGSEPAVTKFVATLVARTKNIRQGMIALGEAASDQIRQTVSQQKWFEEWRRPFAEAAIRNQLREDAPRWQKRKVRRETRKQLMKVREQFNEVIQGVSFPTAAQDAQVRALDVSHAPGIRRYTHLRWGIAVSPDLPFILGDVGPIWQMMEEHRYTVPLLSMAEGRGSLMLPISTDLLLVGSSPETAPKAIIDTEQVNRASARLSIEFFISAENTEREGHYHCLIGIDRDEWIRREAQ